MNAQKKYLGDSVYCKFDGFMFILTTQNGCGPSNIIALEPSVLVALNRFAKQVQEPDHQILNEGTHYSLRCACGHRTERTDPDLKVMVCDKCGASYEVVA